MKYTSFKKHVSIRWAPPAHGYQPFCHMYRSFVSIAHLFHMYTMGSTLLMVMNHLDLEHVSDICKSEQSFECCGGLP